MRNSQRNSIITSKRAARDKALASAGSYQVNEHDVYTTATGQFRILPGAQENAHPLT
jgi:hypothetical protein